MSEEFKIGDSVTFNKKESHQFTSRAVARRKHGVVVGPTKKYTNCVVIKWDDLIKKDTIAKRFLVKI